RLVWMVASTTLFAVVGIVGFLADLKTLTEHLHWAKVVIAVLALAGITASISLWLHYEKALKRYVKSGKPVEANLGPPRGKIDLQNLALTMLQKPGIHEIDIGGLALRTPYFKKGGEFSEQLEKLVRADPKLKVRIWLLAPKSTPLILRELAEEIPENRLGTTCLESLETLTAMIQKHWREQGKRSPNVVL